MSESPQEKRINCYTAVMKLLLFSYPLSSSAVSLSPHDGLDIHAHLPSPVDLQTVSSLLLGWKCNPSNPTQSTVEIPQSLTQSAFRKKKRDRTLRISTIRSRPPVLLLTLFICLFVCFLQDHSNVSCYSFFLFFAGKKGGGESLSLRHHNHRHVHTRHNTGKKK